MSSGVCVNHLLETNSGTIQASNLSEHILAVIVRHLHSSVVIRQGRVRHFESLDRDGADTPQVCLITLAFQNCFLSEFNSILFFKLTDHCLEEFKLVFLLNNFGVDFYTYFLVESPLVMLVSSDFSKELHTLKCSSYETLLVELLTEHSVGSFACSWSSIIVEESENELLSSSLEPSIHSNVYNVLKVLVL